MKSQPTGRMAGILQLQQRMPDLPPNNEVEAALYGAMTGIVLGCGRYADGALAIEADTRWSRAGRLEQLQKLAAAQADWLRTAAEAIDVAHRYIETRQSAIIGGLKPDPNDVVGELRRQELRACVRALSPSEVVVLAGTDPIIGEAVLTAHSAASGLTAADHEKVRTRYLTIHPDTAALDRLKEMIAAVTSALAMAKSEMDDSLGGDLPVVAA